MQQNSWEKQTIGLNWVSRKIKGMCGFDPKISINPERRWLRLSLLLVLKSQVTHKNTNTPKKLTHITHMAHELQLFVISLVFHPFSNFVIFSCKTYNSLFSPFTGEFLGINKYFWIINYNTKKPTKINHGATKAWLSTMPCAVIG